MAQQSKGQKETVGRVMHEYKHGELKTSGAGPKVKNPKQAIAIALHEAGASRDQSENEQEKSFRRTKEKERKGETAEAESEGKEAQDRTLRGRSAAANGGGSHSKSELYAEAKRRGIAGRSSMSKQQLERALEK